MVKKNLTNLSIKKLKPPEKGQVTVWDKTLSGFGVRCSQGGTKTFVLQYGPRDARKLKSIGRYDIISLADARQRAKEILASQTLQPGKVASPTFDVAKDRYLRLREPELRRGTYKEYKRIIEKYFQFQDVPVEDISTEDVVNIIDTITSPSERGHAYVSIKVFFNWCIERKYCSSNPLATIRRPKKSPSRERVLDDAELKAIWHAVGSMKRYRDIVRLLIVTGQRRGEIARMHENWIDEENKIINFPANVMKNKKSHSLPYGSLADGIFFLKKPVDGFLFSPSGMPGVPFSAWSKNKSKLNSLLPPMEPWTLHDLRRTWSTNAAKLDIPPHITDRVLSHSAGSISEIARIYNRHKYEHETKEAMLRMNEFIKDLVFQ